MRTKKKRSFPLWARVSFRFLINLMKFLFRDQLFYVLISVSCSLHFSSIRCLYVCAESLFLCLSVSQMVPHHHLENRKKGYDIIAAQLKMIPLILLLVQTQHSLSLPWRERLFSVNFWKIIFFLSSIKCRKSHLSRILWKCYKMVKYLS